MEAEKFVRPDKIYKYVDAEICKIILKNQTLKFNNPVNFNDPLDCFIDNLYFDVRGNLDPRIKSEIDLLKTQYPAPYLTDSKLNEIYGLVQRQKIEKSGISCFSLISNNMLMWSHYADKHRGMCLEFDYSKTIDEANILKEVRIDLEGYMKYGNMGVVNYCENKVLGMAMLFLYKQNSWAYEAEYRLLTLAGEGIYKFKPEFLESITFGLNASKEDIFEVTELCKASHFKHLSLRKTCVLNRKLHCIDI